MSRLSALCISATLAVLAQWTQAATLVASVDRSRLNSGETVELTLETNDVTQFGKPDLTPLEGPFEVRDTRQVNRLTSLDGDHQATTRWIITLLPPDRQHDHRPPAAGRAAQPADSLAGAAQ